MPCAVALTISSTTASTVIRPGAPTRPLSHLARNGRAAPGRLHASAMTPARSGSGATKPAHCRRGGRRRSSPHPGQPPCPAPPRSSIPARAGRAVPEHHPGCRTAVILPVRNLRVCRELPRSRLLSPSVVQGAETGLAVRDLRVVSLAGRNGPWAQRGGAAHRVLAAGAFACEHAFGDAKSGSRKGRGRWHGYGLWRRGRFLVWCLPWAGRCRPRRARVLGPRPTVSRLGGRSSRRCRLLGSSRCLARERPGASRWAPTST